MSAVDDLSTLSARPAATALSSRAWNRLFPAVLLACAFLLFVRLGAYPLWDDEACTAILARGVWHSGDSLAVQGDNVMAYGLGRMLFGTVDRVHPPLQLYVMAPFVGLLGETSALAARLPMALAGLAAIAVLLRLFKSLSPTPRQVALFVVLLLTNVALFLFLRQARYYALATLDLVLAAGFYLRLPARPTPRQVLPLGIALGVLPLISSQLFAIFPMAFLADYLVFGRRRVRFSPGGWVALLGPSAVGVAFILATWNPLVISNPEALTGKWWYRPLAIWYTLRDLNRASLGVGGLLLLAPLLGVLYRSAWLLRGSLAVLVCCVVEGLVDPQSPEHIEIAQIRHLAPIIPLTLALAVLVIDRLWTMNRLLGLAVLLLASFTNVLNWGALDPLTRLRSYPYLWARELILQPKDPYSVALAYLKDQLPPGSLSPSPASDASPAKVTVGVLPDYMRYPLMYHRPDLIYTWQIEPAQRARLPHISAAQFIGEQPPDYFLVFGLFRSESLAAISPDYRLVHTDGTVYWRDSYRPEITMRDFGLPIAFNPNTEGFYVFKLTPPPPPPH